MQLGIDPRLVPPELLNVLRPFEIRNDHPPRVAENVRYRDDAAIGEYFIGSWGDGVICSLDDEPCLEFWRIAGVDHLFDRRRDQDVAREFDHFVVRHIVALRKTANRGVLLHMLY